MRHLGFLFLLALACQRTPTFQNEPFACATSGECADGYVCTMGRCAPSGGMAGGSAGGATAGGATAGGSTGGGSTGGGSTGGGSTGGGSTGGGSTGGGSTGGGSTAGGSTAGGSTAGGAGGGRAGGAAGGSSGGTAGGSASDAGLPLGGACTMSGMCAGGLTCVDGACCENTCAGACDVCNLAGQRGRCLAAPAGTACGLFLCTGQQTTCPTTCTADGGCAQGAGCSLTGACVPCWSGFTDDFSSGAGQWNFMGGATITAGRLTLDAQSRNTSPELLTAQTMTALSLRGCGVTVELPAKPDLTANFSGRVGLFPVTGNTPAFRWEMDPRGLVAAWALGDGGVGSAVVASAGATWPRWLRIEESAGEVRFRTATSMAFTTAQTVPHGEALNAVVLRVQAGYPQQPGGDRSTLAVDNVNLGP